MNHLLYTEKQLREAIELYAAYCERGYPPALALETAVCDTEEMLSSEFWLIEEGALAATEQYRQLSWLDTLPERSPYDSRGLSGTAGLGAAFLEHATAPPKKNGSA